MSRHGRSRVRTPPGSLAWRVLLLLSTLLVTSACGGDRTPDKPEAEPTTRVGTVSRAAVGHQLTITAVVHRTLGDTSFVVSDADLTDGRLLVLTPQAHTVQSPWAVTVHGEVVMFRYADFVDQFRLAAEPAYRPYEGRKGLLATRVDPIAQRRPSGSGEFG